MKNKASIFTFGPLRVGDTVITIPEMEGDPVDPIIESALPLTGPFPTTYQYEPFTVNTTPTVIQYTPVIFDNSP